MTESSSPMIFEAVEAFNVMVASLKKLIDITEAYDCEVLLPQFNPSIHDSSPASLREILLGLWHESEGDGRGTLVFQGLVIAPRPVLEQVKAVNETKERFHALMKAINKSSNHTLHEARHAISQKTSVDRDLLKYTGLARLNLNHCYRAIPFYEHSIIKAGFSWSQGELSINKVTPEEAIEQLINLNRDMPAHIAIQIEKASGLSPNAQLAKVQVNNPRLKANIVAEVMEADGQPTFIRKTVRTSLPLFVLKGSKHPEVVFRDRPDHKSERLVRLDRRIEEEPFLPSIRVHLYK